MITQLERISISEIKIETLEEKIDDLMYNVAIDLWGDIMYENDTGDIHWFKKSQIDELENILQNKNSFEILKYWDKLEFYLKLKKEL